MFEKEESSYEMHEKILSPLKDSEENLNKENFLKLNIDFEHSAMNFDASPLCIQSNMVLSKVHYLFIHLGVSSIYVTEKNELLGIIKKTDFLNLNTHKK